MIVISLSLNIYNWTNYPMHSIWNRVSAKGKILSPKKHRATFCQKGLKIFVVFFVKINGDRVTVYVIDYDITMTILYYSDKMPSKLSINERFWNFDGPYLTINDITLLYQLLLLNYLVTSHFDFIAFNPDCFNLNDPTPTPYLFSVLVVHISVRFRNIILY